MAQQQAVAAKPAPSTTVKVRVKAENYGPARDPIARRGDIIEVERKEFEFQGPDVFVDIAAESLQQINQFKMSDTQINEHNRMKEALAADRQASRMALAKTLRTQALDAVRAAEAAEKALLLDQGK